MQIIRLRQPWQPPMCHLPLAPVTLNAQWRISILTWTQGPTMNQEAGRRGQTKGKATKLGKAKAQGQKLHSKGTTTYAHSSHLLVNSRSTS